MNEQPKQINMRKFYFWNGSYYEKIALNPYELSYDSVGCARWHNPMTGEWQIVLPCYD